MKLKVLKNTLLFLALSLNIFAFAHPALAAFNCDNFKSQFNIPGTSINAISSLPIYCDAQSLMIKAINVLLALAGTAAVIFIILGGFWLISAGGNEEQAEKGRKVLTNSVIGLVVIIMAFALVKIVTNLLTAGNSLGGAPAATNTGGNANNNSPAQNSGGGGVQFQGDTFTDVTKPYSFTVTVPASIVASAGCQFQPVGYMTVTKKDGSTQNLGSFSTSGGGLSGSFTTDVPTNLGYDPNAIGDFMPLGLYVCGQSQGGWDITLKSSPTNSKQCDPKNNDPTTHEDIKDCGGTEMTCSGQGICQDMSLMPTCDPTKNDPRSTANPSCGALQTCNSSNQCVDIQNPNGNTSSASQSAANIRFTASLSDGNKTLQINLQDDTLSSDKLKICGGSFSSLSQQPAQIYINGSLAGTGTAADNVFTVKDTKPISGTLSISICGVTVGGGPQTIQ